MSVRREDYFDENTKIKFYDSLREYGFDEATAWSCLHSMSMKGLLFREVDPFKKTTPSYLTRSERPPEAETGG